MDVADTRIRSVTLGRARAARPDFADVAAAELDGVHRYLVHMLRDPVLAEDVTSATFERALRDWRRYDPAKGRPGVWLIEIARRQALDHLRSEGRRRRREERFAAMEPRSAPEPRVAGIPEEMRVAMTALTQSERELVALRIVLGVDTAEAARITGTTPSAVSTALHRALAKLRTRLQDVVDV
ncbi:MAG: sigma-70 family RNA polymerase sigma factor [Thermoleophilia bacterium]|nr:sigma-70 family RNA polymerase sigma factor [Thermoleophilia bacterium]